MRILSPLGIEIKTAAEMGLLLPDAEETGNTFAENALLKARSGCLVSGRPTLADDSGLCVDALDGAPGIYSARYSGGSDEDNNDKLLAALRGVPAEKRTAHYACAIAAVFPDGRELVSLGTVEGKIGFARKGNGGFGYDPLFLYGEKTYAEVPAEEKDRTSHRSVALHKMYELLKEEVEYDR